jgi:cellulose biosynthesis protein BcsQ
VEILKSVAFFNNKGGVGKTTLTCNLANYCAKQGLRTLVIDADPQSNATQLILDSDTVADLYWNVGASDLATMADLLRPYELGEASIGDEPIALVGPDKNRFGVSLMPGHPRLSVLEDLLGQWFQETTAGDFAGIRKTNWATFLLRKLEPNFDLVLFDLGPSLGALNRSILVATDHFLTPMGADIFSLVALRNIADWLEQWTNLYSIGIDNCKTRFKGALEEYELDNAVDMTQAFIGYTVQQYITVTIRGERRATRSYEKILGDLPQRVLEAMESYFTLDPEVLNLGDVPNLYSLIPLAQIAKSPISGLTGADGLSGGAYAQQRQYSSLIESVGIRMLENLGLT